MKTFEIKDFLKKDLLVVEMPRVCDYKLTKEMIFIMDKERSTINRFKGSYTLLGNPDEISEEDAAKLFYNPIDITNLTHYANLRNLFSLIESEIYWKNPIELETWENDFGMSGNVITDEWKEAQEKTFDRKRSLIFKKN